MLAGCKGGKAATRLMLVEFDSRYYDYIFMHSIKSSFFSLENIMLGFLRYSAFFKRERRRPCNSRLCCSVRELHIW